MVVALQLRVILRGQLERHVTAKERCQLVIAAVAKWSIFGTALRLVLLITPPIFFQLIFMPCWECFDFEAAVTHEVSVCADRTARSNESDSCAAASPCRHDAYSLCQIGHVLGLGHPDTVGEANVYHEALSAGGRMDKSSCMEPWARVREGVPPGATLEEVGVRPSIMLAFTQHNPKVRNARGSAQR